MSVAFPCYVCSVEGCNNPHHARGLCNKHYRRAKLGIITDWEDELIEMRARWVRTRQHLLDREPDESKWIGKHFIKKQKP